MDPRRVEELRAEGLLHLSFMTNLYNIHVDGGRYVLHEHPATANSWDAPCMQEILSLDGVNVVISDIPMMFML